MNPKPIAGINMIDISRVDSLFMLSMYGKIQKNAKIAAANDPPNIIKLEYLPPDFCWRSSHSNMSINHIIKLKKMIGNHLSKLSTLFYAIYHENPAVMDFWLYYLPKDYRRIRAPREGKFH